MGELKSTAACLLDGSALPNTLDPARNRALNAHGGEMFQALLPAVSRFRGDGRRITGRYGKELRACVRWAALSVLLAALPCWASRAVVDELGRQVVVPDHPHRVVCLAPSIVDTMYALSAGEDIAGITDYVKYAEEAR